MNIHAQDPQKLYTTIQGIYASSSTIAANDCKAVHSLLAKLEKYTTKTAAVPSSKAYSVNYPEKVKNPTIGDLAKDRIARLESKFYSCMVAKEASGLYTEVQNIYLGYEKISATDCKAVKSLETELQTYTRNKVAVPTDKAYTVIYPDKVTNPTIGDLAKDRIARVQGRFQSCFEDQKNPEDVFKNTLGTWIYMHNGKEFQIKITEKDDSYVATFKKQGYSYTPVYTGKITSYKSFNSVEDRIRFKFELTKEHLVSIRFAVNNSKVSAYIFESWNNKDSWSALAIKRTGVTKGETRKVIHKTTKVAITFYNQTKSKALVYSVDGKGKKSKDRILSPGEACVQDTFSTHKWLVRMKGRDNLEYTATNDASQLVRIK